MKKILHSYPNFVIGTIAVLLLAILIAFYLWAVNDAVAQLRGSLVAPPPQRITGFDLGAAAQLDYRGLTNLSTSTSGN